MRRLLNVMKEMPSERRLKTTGALLAGGLVLNGPVALALDFSETLPIPLVAEHIAGKWISDVSGRTRLYFPFHYH